MKKKTKEPRSKAGLEFRPDVAIPPGATLQETMESLGWSQKELAERTELTVMSLNRIFKGEQPISYETAGRLELVTGVPARFWNNLEANYREQLARLAERSRLEEDLDWLETMPTAELIRRGAIEAADDAVDLLRQVLSFFGVSSVAAWKALWANPAVAARRSTCFETRLAAAATWIRLGEREAADIECRPFRKQAFHDTLDEVRGLTREDPDQAFPRLQEMCAACGVAVAFVPEFPKVPWNGATKWLTPDKAMILLNLRGKAEDRLWFSFCHEAGHVLHDGKKELFINAGPSDDEREKAADQFASNLLIPHRYHDRIREAHTPADIRDLADEIGVCPGIVAGRYQFLTSRWAAFKDLIRPLAWHPA